MQPEKEPQRRPSRETRRWSSFGRIQYWKCSLHSRMKKWILLKHSFSTFRSCKGPWYGTNSTGDFSHIRPEPFWDITWPSMNCPASSMSWRLNVYSFICIQVMCNCVSVVFQYDTALLVQTWPVTTNRIARGSKWPHIMLQVASLPVHCNRR